MDIIKAEDIIAAAWEQFFGGSVLPNAWRSGLGLFFNVEIEAQNHGYERDGSTHHEEWEREFYRSLQFVVTAQHEVFVHSSDRPEPTLDAARHVPDAWQNPSNHDSCWSSDGLRLIWTTLAEAHRHCWDHVPAEHQKSMHDMQRSCSVNTSVFSHGLIQLVRVTTEVDPKASGRRRMKALQKAAFMITLVDAEPQEEKASSPSYEADDGPLTATDFDALREVASAALPRGEVLNKQSLF